MTSKDTFKKVGVIGTGSFGSTIANILAKNSHVIIYGRDADQIANMNSSRTHRGVKLHANIEPTNNLEYLANSCSTIFPIISSSGFRSVIKQLSPFLHPYHILIHGTKGLDISIPDNQKNNDTITRNEVKTMSEVITDETVVVRVGCLAGPNLAKELSDGQPGATVIASHFDEVRREGERLLRNDRFQVYGNEDLIGIELVGVLKNIIAIAAGALNGLGMGENARGLLVSRGMVEMIYLGKALGGNTQAFLGLAGIGDLVATCNSTLSRNFTVGHRLAKGETLNDITDSMDEIAEGVNTVRIVKKLADYYKVKAPITEILHKVLFEGFKAEEALQRLMRYPFNVDISFL
ncbi:MAG: NAD(P)-dependent glycerol-3-phosphate dehydrogenase [Cyclobacteriaceae bacterium]|nr:NAD(P)-dependent glycerol-3-phosphate dehydrogenase [Cyclobacteriaceae bacterium]